VERGGRLRLEVRSRKQEETLGLRGVRLTASELSLNLNLDLNLPPGLSLPIGAHTDE
jgi:hypothetical protein